MLKCLAAPVAAMSFAAPAMAQSTAVAPIGVRIEALAGVDHASDRGLSATGALFGLGAGFDFAVGNTVSLGVDAEATDATTEVSGAKLRRDLYAGGRINFAVSPGANLYAKAGYTNARIDAGVNRDGGRVGVGGQIAVAGKTYVGLEYRYSRYQRTFDRHQLAMTVGTRF